MNAPKLNPLKREGRAKSAMSIFSSSDQ